MNFCQEYITVDYASWKYMIICGSALCWQLWLWCRFKHLYGCQFMLFLYCKTDHDRFISYHSCNSKNIYI